MRLSDVFHLSLNSQKISFQIGLDRDRFLVSRAAGDASLSDSAAYWSTEQFVHPGAITVFYEAGRSGYAQNNLKRKEQLYLGQYIPDGAAARTPGAPCCLNTYWSVLCLYCVCIALQYVQIQT